MSPDELEHIFEHVCTGHRDSLTVDFHKDSPAFLRKNLFEKIDLGNIKKGVIFERMEKLQKKGSIEMSNPLEQEKLKINKNKNKYKNADAGFVSNDSDED